MHGRIRLAAVVALVVVLAAGVAGCRAVVGRVAASEASAGEARLPEGLPGDLPVYRGETRSGGVIEANGATTYTFTVVTGDRAGTVVAWYEKRLAENGWTVSSAATTEVNGQQSGSVVAKKGGMEAVVSAAPDTSDGGRVAVTCVLSVKAE